MAIDFSDCAKLPRGLRKICERDESVDPATVEKYHAAWERRQRPRSVKGMKPVTLRPATPEEMAMIQQPPRRPCRQAIGAGFEMKKLLSELGIPQGWCEGCKLRAKTMDDNGIEWCRANRATIVKWLQKAERDFARDAAALARGDGKEPTDQQIAKAQNAQRWKVGWEAAKRILFINPLDPFGSLIDEAIRRAEAKQTKSDNCDAGENRDEVIAASGVRIVATEPHE